jgi:hypothetical protein
MVFGEAIELVKQGKLVTRQGWNGKRMFIFMRPEDSIPQEVIGNIKSLPQAVKDYYGSFTMVPAQHYGRAIRDIVSGQWVVPHSPDIPREHWGKVISGQEFTWYEKTEVKIKFTAYLCMKAADDTIVNGWLASQTDMLSDDWIEFTL